MKPNLKKSITQFIYQWKVLAHGATRLYIKVNTHSDVDVKQYARTQEQKSCMAESKTNINIYTYTY